MLSNAEKDKGKKCLSHWLTFVREEREKDVAEETSEHVVGMENQLNTLEQELMRSTGDVKRLEALRSQLSEDIKAVEGKKIQMQDSLVALQNERSTNHKFLSTALLYNRLSATWANIACLRFSFSKWKIIFERLRNSDGDNHSRQNHLEARMNAGVTFLDLFERH